MFYMFKYLEMINYALPEIESNIFIDIVTSPLLSLSSKFNKKIIPTTTKTKEIKSP